VIAVLEFRLKNTSHWRGRNFLEIVPAQPEQTTPDGRVCKENKRKIIGLKTGNVSWELFFKPLLCRIKFIPEVAGSMRSGTPVNEI
jgi:hypothetical protein